MSANNTDALVGSLLYRTPKGRMTLGEGPIYRASDSTLHWFDCLSLPCELYILPVDPSTGSAAGQARVIPLADSITVAAFRQDKPGYIAAYYQGVCFLEESGGFKVACEIIPTTERDIRRFNDGGVDAAGRFWLAEIDVKAMQYGPGKVPEEYGTPVGRLWRYDPDGSLHLMVSEGILCGNGVSWSPDNRTMYLNDSVAMMIYAFDFDLETGNISHRRVLVDFRATGGEPDGMIIDSDGNLWLSLYGTSSIVVLSPAGERLKEIKFPAKYPTCPTWGGQNHDIIYLSTGKDRTETPDLKDEGGHMYIHRPIGVRGQAKYEFGG